MVALRDSSFSPSADRQLGDNVVACLAEPIRGIDLIELDLVGLADQTLKGKIGISDKLGIDGHLAATVRASSFNRGDFESLTKRCCRC